MTSSGTLGSASRKVIIWEKFSRSSSLWISCSSRNSTISLGYMVFSRVVILVSFVRSRQFSIYTCYYTDSWRLCLRVKRRFSYLHEKPSISQLFFHPILLCYTSPGQMSSFYHTFPLSLMGCVRHDMPTHHSGHHRATLKSFRKFLTNRDIHDKDHYDLRCLLIFYSLLPDTHHYPLKHTTQHYLQDGLDTSLRSLRVMHSLYTELCTDAITGVIMYSDR